MPLFSDSFRTTHLHFVGIVIGPGIGTIAMSPCIEKGFHPTIQGKTS